MLRACAYNYQAVSDLRVGRFAARDPGIDNEIAPESAPRLTVSVRARSSRSLAALNSHSRRTMAHFSRRQGDQ
jgi:hypothetical protein